MICESLSYSLADFSENDGSVCGGDVPIVDDAGLLEPFLRLGQVDEVAGGAGLAVAREPLELLPQPGPGHEERVLFEPGSAILVKVRRTLAFRIALAEIQQKVNVHGNNEKPNPTTRHDLVSKRHKQV